MNNLVPSPFNEWLLFSSEQHNSWSSLGKSSYKTNTYGHNSFIVSVINAWNYSQKLLEIGLIHLLPNYIKRILSDVLFLQSIEMKCLSDFLN